MTRLSIADIETRIAIAQATRARHAAHGTVLVVATNAAPVEAKPHKRHRWIPSPGELRGIPVLPKHKPSRMNRSRWE